MLYSMRAFTFKVVISTYKFGDEIKKKFQIQEQTFHGVSQSPAQSITLLIKRKRGFKHNSKICHLICHEKRFNDDFIFFRRSAGKSCDWYEQCKGDGTSSLGGCNDQPGVKGLHVARSYCQSLNKMVSYWSRELLVVASNYLMVIVRDILHDPLGELLNTLPQKSWFYNEYELFFMLPLKGAPS